MDNNGWICLHRKIIDNPIASKPDYLAVWIHLLVHANHKEKSFIWNNKKITLKAGQQVIGRKALSKRTGVKESQIYKILKYLELEQQIEQQTTTKFTIITILNWNKYQEKNNKNNNNATTTQQQSNTNNNDNNEDKLPKGKEQAPAYGNSDINKFIEGTNKHLELKLPNDGKARRVAKNALELFTKTNSKGEIKKGREFLDDDKWRNASNFMKSYYQDKISEGYSAQSWDKLYHNIKLWIANEGKLK